jgi:exonuclease SbcD
MNREKLKRGELEMFKDFFVQITGQEISKDQGEAIRSTIEELHKQEKNA